MTHPDDIGHARAEARLAAAEDGVMLVDEDDWYDPDEQDAIRAEVNAERLVFCEIPCVHGDLV